MCDESFEGARHDFVNVERLEKFVEVPGRELIHVRVECCCFIYKHDDHIGDHTTNDASRTIP